MARKTEPEVDLHDLVLVKWLDAAGHRDKDESDPVPCLSIGWVVEVKEKDGKQYIKLASEIIGEDDKSFDTQEHVSIPSGMIQKIIKLRTKLPTPFTTFKQAADA